MLSEIRPAIIVLLFFSVLTGLIYPLAITGVSQLVFRHEANGSLIERDSQLIGSELIAQGFDQPQYFWSRPSAASYNAAASTGSNLGPTNPALLDTMKTRVDALKNAHPENSQPVPVDLVTASASGLDPHISLAAAEYQVSRVAQARGLTNEQVRRNIADHTATRTLGVFGEPRVNVLQLNLALDNQNRSR